MIQIFLRVLLLSSVQNQEVFREAGVDYKSCIAAYKIIGDMPIWGGTSSEPIEPRRVKFFEGAAQLRNLGPGPTRYAALALLTENVLRMRLEFPRPRSVWEFGAKKQIFAVNRLLFAIKRGDKCREDEKFCRGSAVRVDDIGIDLRCWPLVGAEFAPDSMYWPIAWGEQISISDFERPYDPIREFDELFRTYGFRDSTGHQGKSVPAHPLVNPVSEPWQQSSLVDLTNALVQDYLAGRILKAPFDMIPVLNMGPSKPLAPEVARDRRIIQAMRMAVGTSMTARRF